MEGSRVPESVTGQLGTPTLDCHLENKKPQPSEAPESNLGVIYDST